MSFIYTDYMNRDNPYPANYVYLAAGVLPALGAPFAPDGTNMTDQQTCLFTGLTLAADRGVFRATVVAGNVTAWTRVIYGQSSTGACTDGDIVIVLEGTAYADHQFQCTDTTTATWVDLGGVTAFPRTQVIYIDAGRTDTYVATGSIDKPFKTILAALAVTNADVGKNWRFEVGAGTYSDNITITGPRLLQIVGSGVVISGTVLINSGVGSYDRIEFKGTHTFRAEKGPAMTISGAITATRTNDSLIYVGFNGCYVSGSFTTTDSGTWVCQYINSRVTGAIDGTLPGFGTPCILIEAYGFCEFTGAISNKVSFYNCNEAEIYSAINITGSFENVFKHTKFLNPATITITNAAPVYVDNMSYNSLKARTPTLAGGAYYNYLDDASYPTVTKVVGDSGYTVTAYDHTIFVDTTGGNVTINLPTAVGINGRKYTFKKVALANTMTIGGGGVLIDGVAAIDVVAALSSITAQSDGTTWWII